MAAGDFQTCESGSKSGNRDILTTSMVILPFKKPFFIYKKHTPPLLITLVASFILPLPSFKSFKPGLGTNYVYERLI